MRFLLATVLLLMFFGLIAFSVNNFGTRVPVTLLQTHADVALWVVVFAAFTLGALVAAIIALAEGTATRLSNRRLRRELHKLETEVNYLRTQPRSPRPEPDAVLVETRPGRRPEPPAAPPSSAPVYSAAHDDTDPDEEAEDDFYSGGRAV